MTSENAVSDRVQVLFHLEQHDGWPPVASERLWAIPMDVNLVRIDSIPWFVRDLSLNDIVRTRTDDQGNLEGFEKVSWSGNFTVRIIPFGSGRFSNPQEIADVFTSMGVRVEGVEKFGMVALSVSPTVNISSVKELLVRGSAAGWWDYEESCIGDKWEESDPR